MQRYDNRYEKRDYKKEALEDASVPPALKRLAEDVIPNMDFSAFRAMVESGEIFPGMGSGDQPLLGPVEQILAMESNTDSIRWLGALFGGDAEKIRSAEVSGWDSYYWTTYTSGMAKYEGQTIATRPLLSVLFFTRGDEAFLQIASLAPELLAERITDREGKKLEPLLHQALSNNKLSVAALDQLEEITGGAEFLKLKNARGETLFYRIAANAGWVENSDRLDQASWMLQRNPKLVNEPDRFGWTPLDRLLANTQGKSDSSMGRFLLASGARLEKQIAPAFNLAAVLRAEEEKRLDKAPVSKLPAPRRAT